MYFENDVEVFIAGQDCYYEFQINARGTIYEVFYIWQDAYQQGGFAERPEFDLQTHPVDVLGGFQDGMRYKKHPRGRRWAFMDWDFPGLQAAVQVDGTLNDPATIDRGWTVELAFPWSGMETLAQGRSLPPRNGDIWRMDFSRFEALQANGRRDRSVRRLVLQQARRVRFPHPRVLHLRAFLRQTTSANRDRVIRGIPVETAGLRVVACEFARFCVETPRTNRV